MAAKFLTIVLTLLALAATLPAHAQSRETDPLAAANATVLANTPETQREPIRSIELSTTPQHLTNDYGDWQDVTLRGVYEMGGNIWQAELSAKREFGQNGNYLGISDTLNLSPDWYAMLSLGAGDGAFYLPQFRADAFLFRKWLAQRNLITSIGTSYYRAPDSHTDHTWHLGAVYYFAQPLILEGGARFNYSDPGAIRSNQYFVAATFGRVSHDVLTVRYAWGREAYQPIASNVTLVDFDSHETSLAWRHWVNRKSGLLLGAQQYGNPSYQRNGITVGLFHQF